LLIQFPLQLGGIPQDQIAVEDAPYKCGINLIDYCRDVSIVIYTTG